MTFGIEHADAFCPACGYCQRRVTVTSRRKDEKTETSHVSLSVDPVVAHHLARYSAFN
jgi:hypothetical protein